MAHTFTEMVLLLAPIGALREKSLDDAVVEVSRRMFADLTKEEVQHAVTRFCMDSKPLWELGASIRKYAMELRHGPAKLYTDAIAAVRKAIRSGVVGEVSDRSKQFLATCDEPTLRGIEAVGGLREIYLSENAEEFWRFNSGKFKCAYEATVASGPPLREIPGAKVEYVGPALERSLSQMQAMVNMDQPPRTVVRRISEGETK